MKIEKRRDKKTGNIYYHRVNNDQNEYAFTPEFDDIWTDDEQHENAGDFEVME